MRSFTFVLLLMATIASAQYYGSKGPSDLGSRRVPTDANINGVRFEQNPGAEVPLDAVLRDENGEEIVFGSLLRGRPLVLLPIFYECEGICNNELNELVSTIRGYGVDALGEQFDVVTFSIKPTENSMMAKAKQDAYLRQLGRPDAEDSWRFLTGELEQIRLVTDAIGFQYTYDETNGDIQHPAGMVVLTPNGKASKYLLRPETPASVLEVAVKEAAKGEIGLREEKPFYLSCIQIDPLSGKVTVNILNTLKVFGVITLIGLVGGIVYMTVKNLGGGEEAA